MDRYIGLDAHTSSCTVAVVGPSGRQLASHVVETNARALVSIIEAIPKPRHLCLEEGALAGWLYEMIAPHVQDSEYRCVKSCPGLGEVRAALLLPVVVTPYRFANKRQFWAYCGLAVISRSSSDWVRTRTGEWVKAPVLQTRGLNKNFNHTLKTVYKGAATTVVGQARDEPLYQHYQRLLDGGTKPNLAKLTIARQIAAISLALWRNQEDYDQSKFKQPT